MSSDPRILLVQERLENDLTLGESHFREFKSALEGPERKRRRQVSLVARDIGETLVSFANADGGTLIVGAEDDGTVSGVEYADDKLEVLRNAPQTHVHADTPLPGVRTRLVPVRDETVLVFDVQKGTRYIHLTSDGRCLQRRDTDTVPVASEQIRFERHEQLVNAVALSGCRVSAARALAAAFNPLRHSLISARNHSAPRAPSCQGTERLP